MFITNKKFVISLLLLTMLGGIVFSNKQSQMPITMSEKEIVEFSTDFNKSLPVPITSELSLIKTQLGSINKSIYSLDFFYSYYKNKSDVKDFDKLTSSMIYQTCNNETTLSILKKNVFLRHQFVTLDKEMLPYIGVSLADCNELMKDKK